MPEPILTTALVAGSLAFGHARTSAVSSEAQHVGNQASIASDEYRGSRSLFGDKQEWTREFQGLVAECSEADWDGYGANPASIEACQKVIRLIELLPRSISLPEASIDPDGEVALDWVTLPQRRLSLSISHSGRISYAWLDGGKKGHGVEELVEGRLPERLLNEILQLSAHASSIQTT